VNRIRLLALCLAASLCLEGAAQQTPAPTVAQAREALQKTEATHPENSPEVASALSDLISIQRDTGTSDATTLELSKREIRIREAVEGPRGKGYVNALDTQADLLTLLNRAPDARPIAEQAFAIAQKEFPGTTEAAGAAGALGRTCSTLGDFPCALQAHEVSVSVARKLGGDASADLMAALNNLGALKSRMGDIPGAIQAQEESLAIAYRLSPNDNHFGVIENNLGLNYLKIQNFDKASEHLNRAVAMLGKLYGSESPRLMQVNRNAARLYTATGQFPLAWKAFDFALKNDHAQLDGQANSHALFAQSLAQGGDPSRAVKEALTSARMSREIFVLQARTLPERQALAYDATRPHGVDTSISVLLAHPELQSEDTYQEVVRSRALVADEMARRQRNLNANNDPETARLLDQLNQARADLLTKERLSTNSPANADLIATANAKMETIERALAQRSAILRADERIDQVTTGDLRKSLPAHSVLISYVLYQRRTVDHLDPAQTDTPSYAAFVLHANVLHAGDSTLRLFDLGPAAPIDDLVRKARAAADAESRSHGLGSTRNERAYRESALAIRRRIWDPLRKQIGTARMALVVPDGNLNLIPFASLPDGTGYLVEHGPILHTLSSERDLVPTIPASKKTGLLAIGSPSFELPTNELAANKLPPSTLRGATTTCEEFGKLQFQPLPGTAREVSDIGLAWRRWNAAEPSQLITGDEATLSAFLREAPHSRVLHLATHAFLLQKGCGSGNPLLHSGLVFAGGGHGESQAILTAQQIASLDLVGVDWAVLSACNTGNGELRDGEGVLGLQRAFRVAGAHSVIMTLWPVDDDAARRFMHTLYAARLERHASTANSAWEASRTLLQQRRAAGQSTHPWYWAGFVESGGLE
jgi:CHAT domain-containing protein